MHAVARPNPESLLRLAQRGDAEALGQLLAWLRQFLANGLAGLARQYVGTQRRRLDLERAPANGLEVASRVIVAWLIQHSSPSRGAIRREEAVLLANALARLPADYREVLVLRHLESLTFPEVAERMGRSLDSVKKLWSRGLVRLRNELEGTDAD